MSNYLRVHIRWMIRRDMPEVLVIEQSGFHSWGEEEFLRVLRERNCIGMVAEHGERIVGFMIYELNKNHLRVFKLATHPLFRRRGVGHQMAAKLIGKLSSHRRTSLEITIRESNLDAQLFLKAQGFKATEVIREEYLDTGEDGYAFARLLDEMAPVGAAS